MQNTRVKKIHETVCKKNTLNFFASVAKIHTQRLIKCVYEY